MDNWKSILNANPIPWLLEDNNPSVRYFTLIDILGKGETDPEARKTKEEIRTYTTNLYTRCPLKVLKY